MSIPYHLSVCLQKYNKTELRHPLLHHCGITMKNTPIFPEKSKKQTMSVPLVTNKIANMCSEILFQPPQIKNISDTAKNLP